MKPIISTEDILKDIHFSEWVKKTDPGFIAREEDLAKVASSIKERERLLYDFDMKLSPELEAELNEIQVVTKKKVA